MRFRKLTIKVQTTDGPYGTSVDFPNGLVVVWADNSMGKSTCVKSILVALGMEAMLTTSQSDLPLPPAVKTRLESEEGEFNVLESDVFLEIENKRGERIVVQRTVKGSRDKNLITVHEGPALTEPDTPVSSKDFFVNRKGLFAVSSGLREFELPGDQIRHGDQVVRISVASRFGLGRLNEAVNPFQEAVGQA